MGLDHSSRIGLVQPHLNLQVLTFRRPSHVSVQHWWRTSMFPFSILPQNTSERCVADAWLENQTDLGQAMTISWLPLPAEKAYLSTSMSTINYATQPAVWSAPPPFHIWWCWHTEWTDICLLHPSSLKLVIGSIKTIKVPTWVKLILTEHIWARGYKKGTFFLQAQSIAKIVLNCSNMSRILNLPQLLQSYVKAGNVSKAAVPLWSNADLKLGL